MKLTPIALAFALSATVFTAQATTTTILETTQTTGSFGSKSFSGSATWTYDSVFDLALDITGLGTTWLNWTLTAVGVGDDTGSYSIVKSGSFSESTLWEDLDPGTYAFSYTGLVKPKSAISLTLTSTISPAVPVPEPETYALLLAGLGLTGLVARRRRSL